jgi:hypothetical protein
MRAPSLLPTGLFIFTGHWPLLSRHSLLATPSQLRLRSRPAGPGADDSNPNAKWLCVDSGWASFGTFLGARHSWGVGSLRLRWPSPQSPDVPAILGAWGGGIDAPEGRSPHSSDIGSLLSPSTQPQPPEFTAGLSSAIRHLSSAIRHLSSAICHLSSAIRHLSSAISPSPFPVPNSAFRIF